MSASPALGREARAVAAALIALIALTARAPQAEAVPPPPAELEVVGGSGWSPEPRFSLSWSPEAGQLAPAAVRYSVTDADGGVVAGPARVALGSWQHTLNVSVPPSAGTYGAAVWLEDALGGQGPAATVKLRYDRVRPRTARPLPPAGWVSRAELPYRLRLSHPAGPLPISGIRGYAVSADDRPEASPCEDQDTCADAETDLRGGTEDDTLVVAGLPDGRSYLHAVAVSGSGMRSATPGHAEVLVDTADPVTRLSGAPAGWASRAVELRATASDSQSGMLPVGDGSPFTAIRVDDRAPVVAAGASARATLIESGVHRVAFYARDAAGNVDDGADANGRRNRPPSVATVRIDREPPAVSFIGSVSPEEPELIQARVVDGLSGPHPTRGTVAVRAAGSGGAFAPLPTTVAGGVLLARWSSDAYPPGSYQFRATGYDAAGNAASSGRRAGGLPMVLPNPLKARSLLFTGFGRPGAGGGAERRVRHGRRPLFAGRLEATSDSPLGGRPIEIVELFDAGARRERRVTRVATDPAGRFGLRLRPGPSREVLAVFGGTGTAAGSASRPLRLGVRGGVRLRVSARRARIGGRPVVFRGRVAHGRGELSPDGAAVELQFRAAGLPWSEFRTVRTNRRGRFRYAYRFSDDDSRGIRFRFRAVVPTQSDWPYEPGGSRPVAVRGY